VEFKKLIDDLSPEIYETLKRGVEIGKWPDGQALTPEQKAICMQAMILWERRKPLEERTGRMPSKVSNCGTSNRSLRFKN